MSSESPAPQPQSVDLQSVQTKTPNSAVSVTSAERSIADSHHKNPKRVAAAKNVAERNRQNIAALKAEVEQFRAEKNPRPQASGSSSSLSLTQLLLIGGLVIGGANLLFRLWDEKKKLESFFSSGGRRPASGPECPSDCSVDSDSVSVPSLPDLSLDPSFVVQRGVRVYK